MVLSLGNCKKADKQCPEWTFYIPNSFTPNGDGLNDTFGPKGTGTESFEMWIYDRTGQQLFHTTDINNEWTGSNCQQGGYTYLIKATDKCGYQHTYSGTIILIR